MDNDAFRKIMATPRPHDSKPQEKFDKKSIRKLVDADLQRTKAGSKKHKREKPAKEKKVDKKKEKKPSKYRDRAEERPRTRTRTIQKMTILLLWRSMRRPRNTWVATWRTRTSRERFR